MKKMGECMKTTICLLGLAIFWLPAPRVTADPTCQLRLDTADRHAWTIRAGDDSIRGDKTKLTLEDDTLYGFLFSEQTRLKLGPDRITGRLAGKRTDLHVERSAEHLLLRGQVGGVRTVASLSAGVFELVAQELQVKLTRRPGGDDAEALYTDDSGTIELRLTGCAPAALIQRPGLLAVVNWLVHNPDQVLPIAPTTGMRSGRQSGSTPVQPPPPPPAARPRPPTP